MPRARRHIEDGALYEMVFRAKEGIPLPCTSYMNLLVRSALARSNRNGRVDLCHFVFVGTHAHIIIRVQNKGALKEFHQELKCRLTRTVKAVLGLERLQLWDGRSTIMRILDFEMAKERIRYLYLNPVSAKLASSIRSYAGVSSWSSLCYAVENNGAVEQFEVPNIKFSGLRPLGNISSARYREEVRKNSIGLQNLDINPNAWFEVFGVTCEEEIHRLNAQLISSIISIERQHAEEWTKKGIRPKSSSMHERQKPSVVGRIPAKKERKIFFLGSTSQVRKEFLEAFILFCDTCSEIYMKLKTGDFSAKWPEAAFVPAYPP